MSDAKNKGLIRLFLISISIPTANFALEFFEDSPLPIGLSHIGLSYIGDLGLYISFCGSGVWILSFVIALRSYGKRGLWLLIGMPIALGGPALFALFVLGYIKVAI